MNRLPCNDCKGKPATGHPSDGKLIDQRRRMEARLSVRVCRGCLYPSVKYDYGHQHYIVQHAPDCPEPVLKGVYDD